MIAIPFCGNVFRIVSKSNPDEDVIWEFNNNEIVRNVEKSFFNGTVALVAIETAKRQHGP